MASTVVAPFLALSLLLFAVVAHGCTPNCPGEQAVPATPVAVPVQSHHGQHDEHGRCPINALKLRVCINVFECIGFIVVPEKVIPTPPEAVPAPLHPGGHSDHGRCPINALKLRVCANIGYGPDDCCSLLSGIADLDAAICLCTAVKANVLGIRVNLPVDLGLILNKCGKTYPTDFTC
ncbi:hypothetical protein DAI22_10g065700 [Oryza sativa Japonica Group]|nr:hypothetical protein DAI22_10g065700 [Oryza sativa Japonica Group]